MRFRFPDPKPSSPTAPNGDRPSIAETVWRWQEVGGIEGASLEWMLDRVRAPQEART